jgi:hypothetical protein
MKKMKLLFTLALPVLLYQGAQAQTSSRLIAASHWVNNGAMFQPSDSTYYTYLVNTRGGDLTHTLKYDNGTTWTFLGDTAFSNTWYYQQDFDANNNITGTTISQWNGAAWVPYSKTINTYSSANLLTSSIYQTWNGSSWSTISRDVYSYLPNNKLQSDQYQLWNTLTLHYDATSQKNYFYDASNHLINETDVNLAGGSPTYTNQIAYSYLGNNLLSTTYTTWDGAAWINTKMYTSVYDTTSNNRISMQTQHWDATSMVWVSDSLALYTNFTSATSNLPRTETDQYMDTSGMWVNYRQYTYAYNSYNQLTSAVGESYNVSVGWEFSSGDPMARYYYGPYSVVSGVKNISNTNGDAKVYPVPAQDMLHIDLSWNEAQAATISITDMSGKVVRQWNAPYGTEYRGGVSVNSLSAGVYMIKVSGEKGEIVKQMVVTR